MRLLELLENLEIFPIFRRLGEADHLQRTDRLAVDYGALSAVFFHLPFRHRGEQTTRDLTGKQGLLQELTEPTVSQTIGPSFTATFIVREANIAPAVHIEKS